MPDIMGNIQVNEDNILCLIKWWFMWRIGQAKGEKLF